MLTKAKRGLLNNGDVAVFNNKVAITMPIQDTYKNVVVVQQNVINYIINRRQVQHFTKTNNRDRILFLVQH